MTCLFRRKRRREEERGNGRYSIKMRIGLLTREGAVTSCFDGLLVLLMEDDLLLIVRGGHVTVNRIGAVGGK